MSKDECQKLAIAFTDALVELLKKTSIASVGYMTQRVTVDVHPAVFHALSAGFERPYGFDPDVSVPDTVRYIDGTHVPERGRLAPTPCIDLVHINATIRKGTP